MPRVRLRFGKRPIITAAVAIAVAAVSTTIAFAVTRDGPPAALVTDLSDESGNVLLNNSRPIVLPVRVVDRRGHTLDSSRIRYRWIAGASLNVSSSGRLHCAERGDAVVRATVGTLTKDLAIRCRPIQGIRVPSWLDLIAGGDGQTLPFEGISADGEPVEYMRARIAILDSTIVSLDGVNIRPLAVGQTAITIAAGDRSTAVRLIVNEVVPSFEHLRPDQIYVARPVRLAQGDTVRWPLPKGDYWLKYLPARDGDTPPTITMQGSAQCMLANPLVTVVLMKGAVATLCTVNGPAAVEVAHGKFGLPTVDGFIALDRTDRYRSSFAKPRKR